MSVKIKTFCIKVFYNKSKGKCAHFITMGKKSNTKRSKAVVYKCKTKSRHERRGEEKHIKREISGIYYKIIYIACWPIFLYLSFKEEK